MDGYTLTRMGGEVWTGPILPDGVRYVATFADGTGFAAWTGRPPAIAGEVVIAVEASADMPWWWTKVRWTAPTDEDHLYVLSRNAFDVLADEAGEIIMAATLLTDGRVIVQTSAPLLGFFGFGGPVVAYRFDPAAYGVGV